jgi:hypothetical protein
MVNSLRIRKSFHSRELATAPPLALTINSTKRAKPFCIAQAAGIADENSRHALGMAQKLSARRRSPVAELEADLTASRERADRAEQWLDRIYGEIEERFLQQSDSRRSTSGAPQRPQNQRRSR